MVMIYSYIPGVDGTGTSNIFLLISTTRTVSYRYRIVLRPEAGGLSNLHQIAPRAQLAAHASRSLNGPTTGTRLTH